MKRTERIALGLRTREGITADTIAINRTHALSRAGLLRHDTDRIVLNARRKITRRLRRRRAAVARRIAGRELVA